MEKMLIVTRKVSTRSEYGDEVIYKDEIDVEMEESKHGYSVEEGDGEDAMFGRDLQDLDSVKSMIELAYLAGKEGATLVIHEK